MKCSCKLKSFRFMLSYSPHTGTGPPAGTLVESAICGIASRSVDRATIDLFVYKSCRSKYSVGICFYSLTAAWKLAAFHNEAVQCGNCVEMAFSELSPHRPIAQ